MPDAHYTDTLWFLDTLVVVHHGPSDEAPFSLLESTGRPGNATPSHRHDEDEVFMVLEGEMTVTLGEETIVLRPGDTAAAPRNVLHRYEVTSTENARWLVLTTPGRFDAFVRELSVPADDAVMPPPSGAPTAAQLEELGAVAARHGIEIVGS
jgi:quercetin dioxygenase-like cupin family protein